MINKHEDIGWVIILREDKILNKTVYTYFNKFLEGGGMEVTSELEYTKPFKIINDGEPPQSLLDKIYNSYDEEDREWKSKPYFRQIKTTIELI